MLRLEKIVKEYVMPSLTVRALKGINLSFRKNEFVSVLGPSGCGKTTLLNIVGGLDRYTSGDLYINGRSTKEFKDKDWDVYRNRRVGFVFQSYNLIPHQTILGNVELSLTIGGISKAERTARAKAVLEKVGLQQELNKRPNQLSGGQCQRVAIARALVNNPEILLADEPTGALDTATSKQIMELIKEIAQERLVIMVTHNPELAEQYSTRIIKMLDGEIQSDTNPYSEKEEKASVRADEKAVQKLNKEDEASKKKVKVKKEKAKMSLWTAFKLSLQNLFTKKARTILTSVAGSIGIIGVSLVLAISYGVQGYVNNMQNDMLSGYPISVASSGMDFAAFLENLGPSERADIIRESNYVNIDNMLESIAKQASQLESIRFSNNITQEYIDYVLALPKEQVAAVHLGYGLDVTPNIYTSFKENGGSAEQTISLTAIRNLYTAILNRTEYAEYSSMITSFTNILGQAIDNEDYLLQQYDKLAGRVANGKNEIMVVLDNDGLLTDIMLAQLGYYTQDEFINIVDKVSESDNYNPALDKEKISYSELMGKTFTWYPNNTVFTKNPQYNPDFDPETASMPELLAMVKDGAVDNSSFFYNHNADGFTEGEELTVVGILQPKANISYGSLKSGFYYTKALTEHIIQTNIASEITEFLKQQSAGGGQDSFASGTTGTGAMKYRFGVTYKFDYNYLNQEGTQKVNYEEYSFVGSMSSMSSLAGLFPSLGISEIYSLSIRELGGKDIASRISIYPINFDKKQLVLEYLNAWNGDGSITVNDQPILRENREDIKYTDNLSLIMNMINQFITIITIALVGFVSLSLVVSSVMIGIITYVSVVERVKEIGVIRSLGGRKRDVSNLFIAETGIIGFASGMIGIITTYIVSIIINLIVARFQAGLVIASFPWHYAVIMVAISVGLTLVSGLLPARAAAKKDPVVALRTE